MALRLPSLPIFDLPILGRKTSRSSSRCPPFTRSPPPSFSPLHFSGPSGGASTLGGAGRGEAVPNAVTEEQRPSSTVDGADLSDDSPSSSAAKDVLVVGGTGGVGQLVVASLLDRNIKSRLLLRDPEKAALLFGGQDEDNLKVLKGDTRNPGDLDPAIFEGVTHVICCTGTTAFPSRRWDGDNTPEKVDWEGVRNLVSALPPTLKRFVLVSSIGVTKFNELPWSIMNLFGVLKFKKMGEDFVRNSGLPFTIIRAGRLTDGPYTSYDLNTLLKATAGERRAVIIGQGDSLVGEVSRLVVAEACIQALDIEFTQDQIYEINSIKMEPYRLRLGTYGQREMQDAIMRLSPGYFLNPRYQYSDNVHNDGEVRACTIEVIRRLSRNSDKRIEAEREGEGPGSNCEKWEELFKMAQIN